MKDLTISCSFFLLPSLNDFLPLLVRERMHLKPRPIYADGVSRIFKSRVRSSLMPFRRVSNNQPGYIRFKIRPYGRRFNSLEGLLERLPPKPWPAIVNITFQTGAYIAVAGAVLIMWPSLMYKVLLIDKSQISIGWVRVLAAAAVLFGTYYIGAALDQLETGKMMLRFHQCTILGRFWLVFTFAVLVAMGQCSKGVIVIALLNLLSALRTLHALEGDK